MKCDAVLYYSALLLLMCVYLLIILSTVFCFTAGGLRFRSTKTKTVDLSFRTTKTKTGS